VTNSLNFILKAIDVKRGTIRFMLDICNQAITAQTEISYVTTWYIIHIKIMLQCMLYKGQWTYYYTQKHTIVLLLFWNLSETTRVSRYQKGENQEGKTNLDLLEPEIVSGSSICWTICKSAPHPR